MFYRFGNCGRFLWILIILCFVSQSRQGIHQRKLLNDLFESYNVLERPVENENEKVVLTFSITLMQILKLDIQEQVLTTNMWLLWNWNDSNLRWDPSEYGNLSDIRIPSNKIWTADVLMYNNADKEFDGSYHGTNVVVTNSGNCTYIPPGIFRSTCKIDTTWFPFDEQKCDMKFGSWTYNGNDVDLEMQYVDGAGDLSNLIANGEWEVKSFNSRKNEIVYMCCPEPYVDITYTLHMKRRSEHYHYNIIIPSALVGICGLLVFVLPPDSGSKLTFGVATLALLYICQQNSTEFRTPDSVPLIHTYFSYLFTFNLLSLISCVFVLNVDYRNSIMPKWIRSFFLERLPPFLLMRPYRQKVIIYNEVFPKQEMKNIRNTGNVNEANENAYLIITELQKINEKFRTDELVEEVKNEWNVLAIVLDRIFIFLFGILFIIVTIRA